MTCFLPLTRDVGAARRSDAEKCFRIFDASFAALLPCRFTVDFAVRAIASLALGSCSPLVTENRFATDGEIWSDACLPHGSLMC